MSSSSSSNTLRREQNKRLVRQFFEALDKHLTDKMDQLVSSTDYSLHFCGMPPLDWTANKREFLAPFNKAFPDLTRNIVDMVAEGDKVAVSINVTGTYKGEFQGIPATGKQVSFTAMDILTIKEGKITEEWATADMMGLMQQIGAIPTRSGLSNSENDATTETKG
ncbi:MAG: ester cyclase [Thermoproteota archaeon]|nr:ester cyclase [Thermoproteota archaeon]